MTPCPRCGSEEPGFFCRFCGTKLAPAAGGEFAGGSSGGAGAADFDDGDGAPCTQPLGLPPQAFQAGEPALDEPTQAAYGELTHEAPQRQEPYQPAHVAHAYEPAAFQQPYEQPYQHADDPAHQRAWPADGDQAAYPPPRSAGSSKVFGVILGILAASFIALGVWWMTHRSTQTDDVVGPPPIAPTSAPSTGASAASPPASPATSNLATSNPAPTTPAPTRTVAAEQARAALATLQSSRDAARARVTLDGHWAAQLASKHDGIVDPMQTTASGGHTFGYADILAEVQQLQGAHGTGVIVLRGTDFGRQTSRSKATFVTLYDAGFASSAQAQAWCAKAFPGVTGKALANKCVPRSLRAPYN